jgi:hypothetical protein
MLRIRKYKFRGRIFKTKSNFYPICYFLHPSQYNHNLIQALNHESILQGYSMPTCFIIYPEIYSNKLHYHIRHKGYIKTYHINVWHKFIEL